MDQPGDEKNTLKEKTRIVDIAAEPCHQDEAGNESIVTTPANKPTTGRKKRNNIPFSIGRRNAAVTPGVTRNCDYCDDPYEAKRATSKYCSPNCRHYAWLERNPEKAAELAIKDKERLKAHIMASGGTWEDRE